MVVTSYNNTMHSLESIDGPEEAWLADGMFFEIDIETQETNQVNVAMTGA